MQPDALLSESLLEAGWRQGTLFKLQGANYFWNEAIESNGETRIEGRTREIKANELLILASQDCDILSREEQAVEALLVRTKNKPSDRKYLARILNSYRQFVLDADLGLVADARIRFHIAKSLLKHSKPETWQMHDHTRADFVDWLAGRFDRPPVPQAVFEALSRPVRNVLERMREETPEAFLALDRSVRMVRVRLPPDDSSPLDPGLVLIVEDALDDAGADAIDAAINAIEFAIKGSSPDCDLKIETIPYSAVLLREFDATRPIDLEYMTDQGDEVVVLSTEPTVLQSDRGIARGAED